MPPRGPKFPGHQSEMTIRTFSLLVLVGYPALAQRSLTWQQVRDEFEANNLTLQAARIGIEESRDQEITAYLRPNPDFTAGVDQLALFAPNPYRPLAYLLPSIGGSYLHERQHKRELRRDSARQATALAQSSLQDQERNLLFTLRSAFIQALQAKAVVQLAQDNLAYYDRVLQVNRDRRQAGDIAQVDLGRLELQRISYVSDLQTAQVNARTARIQLLMLLNDRTPVEQFDVTGPFDAIEPTLSREEFRQAALDARPDLKAAMQAIEKARTDHQLAFANGSTDPAFGLSFSIRNPPIPEYIGFNVSIPLRIFDRNQGEKARTEADIRRNERLREATRTQIFSDVDSAHATLSSVLTLVREYKNQYLAQAGTVRDTVDFAYRNGGASLLDFLSAQNDYRTLQLNYLNLIGSYLTAANQLNLAVGREVIP